MSESESLVHRALVESTSFGSLFLSPSSTLSISAYSVAPGSNSSEPSDGIEPLRVNTYTEKNRPMRLLCRPSSTKEPPETQRFLGTASQAQQVMQSAGDVKRKDLHRAVTSSSSTSSSRRCHHKENRRNPRYWYDKQLYGSHPQAAYCGISRKTVHTLYAGSFLVYLLNVASDWVHTFYACRGITVTFPLKTWCVAIMVGSCVLGSTLNFLLIHLCCENALRPPLCLHTTGDGCWRQYFIRLKHWITSFDCFRVSFLILMLEDAPLTMVNFWLLSGCMVANPRQPIWPMVFASLTTVISLVWRLVMVFYAFKHLNYVRVASKPKSEPNHCPAPSHLKTTFLGNSEHSGTTNTTLVIGLNGSRENIESELGTVVCSRLFDSNFPRPIADNVSYEFSAPSLEGSAEPTSATTRLFNLTVTHARECCYCCVFCFLYFVAILLGCLPCINQQCRTTDQEQYKRTLRRVTTVCSVVHHATVLVVSTLICLTTLSLNVLWLQSILLLGNDRYTINHVSQLCIRIDIQRKTVEPLMAGPRLLERRNATLPPWLCKPLFELEDHRRGAAYKSGYRWELNQPHGWVIVQQYETETLTLWTNVQMGERADELSVVWFDMQVSNETNCRPLARTDWSVLMSSWSLNQQHSLWQACDCTYRLQQVNKLTCAP
uniref:G-protein coupled receptors family 1 profile domain-containing protein n=1 Tax=Trichuris muris TaxID=70415 RepID=A0A5S6QZW8_TRIMR